MRYTRESKPRERSRFGLRSFAERTDWLPAGQSLVEFCLVLPLLLVFLSIAVDVTRYLHIRMVLEEIATDAARYATVKDARNGSLPTSDQVDDRISSIFPKELGRYTIQKNLVGTVGGEPAVSVKLTCQAVPYSPLLNNTLASPFMIQAEAWHPRR